MSRFKFKPAKAEADSPCNGAHAKWADAAITAFDEAKGEKRTPEDDETDAQDLISDVLHYCDSRGFDSEDVLRRAANNWRAER